MAAAADGRHVMLSSYFGGEMRGGRTEATVVTRDEPIVGMPPIVPRLDAAIVLHPAFLGDALPRLVDAPLIVVTDAWAWADRRPRAGACVAVPAREIAADLGVPVAAGFVLVGAFARAHRRRRRRRARRRGPASSCPPHRAAGARRPTSPRSTPARVVATARGTRGAGAGS